MPPLIAFDIDGPLVFDNWRLHGFFVYMNSLGIQCDYELFVATGKWDKAVRNFTRPEVSAAWCRYVKHSGLYDEPTPGAVAALLSIAKTERIIATARTATERAATLEFLHRHYGAFQTCHFELDCKIAVAREAHVFIDDNIGIANAVAEHSTNGNIVILFPTPGLSRKAAHQRVIVLEAEKQVTPDMTKAEWPHICENAWAEITTIIQPSLTLA